MTEVEFVDVVDLHDVVIGAVARPLLRSSSSNHRVVHVLARDAEDRLLLQRPAAALKKPFQLGSSVAGHVRSGESYDAAARREFEEELGARPLDMGMLGKTWLDEGDVRKFIGVFAARATAPLRPDPVEVEEVVALEIAEVRKMLRVRGALSPTFHRVFTYAEQLGHFG